MTRRYLVVLLALSALASTVSTSTPFAQTQRANQGSVQGVEACQARAGGTRIRRNNCEAEEDAPRTQRTEHEVTVRLEAPVASGPQCEASTLTEYAQRNTTARITGTVSIANCPAGTTGSFTLVARVRDEAGEIKPIEFSETWQRDDSQDHVFDGDYPIGEHTELVNVRVRNLTCSCAAAAAPQTTVQETPTQPSPSPPEPL